MKGAYYPSNSISSGLTLTNTNDFFLATDEESNKDRTEQEQEQDIENSIDQVIPDSPRSSELGNPANINTEDNKSKSLSERVINSQGKSLKIHIPLTNPTRTFSAITYLLRDDMINQSSKKCGPNGRKKLHINRTKLKHAEKMIRGAFIELYKGLGYLKTYRYATELTTRSIYN